MLCQKAKTWHKSETSTFGYNVWSWQEDVVRSAVVSCEKWHNGAAGGFDSKVYFLPPLHFHFLKFVFFKYSTTNRTLIITPSMFFFGYFSYIYFNLIAIKQFNLICIIIIVFFVAHRMSWLRSWFHDLYFVHVNGISYGNNCMFAKPWN